LADVTAEGERAGGASTADTASQDAEAGPEGPAELPGADGAAPGSPAPPAAARDTTEETDAAERAPRKASRLLSAHWQFGVVIVLAAALRGVVMLGYPPILFYSDSYNYISDAVTKAPDVIRSDGYPLFLYLLLPFHSLTLIAALQALMGLAMGAAIYAVLRRRGLPWWGATLPALPVLFDVYEIQIEHMVMSDVLFIFLVTVALAALCWSDRPPFLLCAVAGLMIGYAGVVRTVGEPLLVVLVIGLLLRRVDWRRTAVLLVAGVLPIAGYMFWYHGFYGQYALDTSSGTFLYSRVSTFAKCSQMSLPADLKVLCDPTPPAKRPNSQEYLWSINTPLYKVSNGNPFTPAANSMAGRFARAAIEAEPLAYARAVAKDFAHTFTWDRTQSDLTGSGPSFQFEPVVTPVTANKTLWWVLYYPAIKSALLRYGGPSLGQPTVVQPYAGFIRAYQKVFYLRGTMLGGILLLGAAGIIARWRRWGGLALLPWAVTAALLILPPMTAGFSYRYALAAVPAACLAAGLALSREPRAARKAALPAAAADTDAEAAAAGGHPTAD